MLKRILFCISLLLLGSCVSMQQRKSKKEVIQLLRTPLFDNHFTGFVVFEPNSKKTFISHNSTKYFTPASNTKIFTLYAGLKTLPDLAPSIDYIQKNDTLFIKGTGNPALFHPYFKDSTAIHFIKKHSNIALYFDNFHETKYGPGWAWEDYDQYYSPERGSFPMYGNVATQFLGDSLHSIPAYFRINTVIDTSNVSRELTANNFNYPTASTDTITTPFITSTTLTKTLLEEATGTKITLTNHFPEGEKQTLYGIPTDSLYKRMMHESDNFIAEQLLLMGASTLTDTINSKITRDYILKKHLANLKHPPRWVDGSGLSRYNLFTPESMVDVLNKLYADVPQERLFHLFKVEGELENGEPYIYAKSGALSNNYCLSGYLITKSGKVLIFSFMNNHYKKPTSEIKKQMQSIFHIVYSQL